MLMLYMKSIKIIAYRKRSLSMHIFKISKVEKIQRNTYELGIFSMEVLSR